MALLHRSHRSSDSPSSPSDLRPAGRPTPTGRGPVRAAAGARPVRLAAPPVGGPSLPPSVARVAARTRLSAELLAAILEVECRHRATLDDMERADALADRLLARRRDRLAAADPARRLTA